MEHLGQQVFVLPFLIQGAQKFNNNISGKKQIKFFLNITFLSKYQILTQKFWKLQNQKIKSISLRLINFLLLLIKQINFQKIQNNLIRYKFNNYQKNKFIAQMQTRQIISSQIQTNFKLIDADKIKTILSKKLQKKVSNPQQLIEQLNDQIKNHIERTEQQISKSLQQQLKIIKVQQHDLKSRNLLKEKITMKLQKTSSNKSKQQKQKLQKKLNARKLKQQFIQNRKKQIKDSDFKPRLQKFRQYMSVGKSIKNKEQTQQLNKSLQNVNSSKSLLKHSIRKNIDQAQTKSKQLQEIHYFKTMEKISKRKIYDKIQPKTQLLPSIDKSQTIEKLNQHKQSKLIQKLGQDLAKIQQARSKRQKQLKSRLQKTKKQNQLLEQQRFFRVQTLKQNNLQKLKSRKQLISKKNEKFITMRTNKSTPTLLFRKNMSNVSDNQPISPGRTISEWKASKLSRTVENFKISVDDMKSLNFFEKEKQKRAKKQVREILSKVIKEEKLEILMK